MTSKKSLVKPRYKNNMLFTYFYTLRKNIVFMLLAILGIGGFGTLRLFSWINNVQYMVDSPAATPPDIRELTKFVIFTQDVVDVWLITAGVAGLSVLTGLFLFRFIANKKTVNVYYSLGATRTQLFLPKLFAGATLLVAGIVIAFLYMACLNLYYFGSCKELWQGVTSLITSYCTVALVSLAASACVFANVGTILEGAAFSGIALLSPMIFIYELQNLMSRLVYGSPYAIPQGYITLLHNPDSHLPLSLIDKLSFLNPLLFHAEKTVSAMSLTRYSIDDKFEWTAPNYKSTLVWLAIGLGITALATWLFKRRKAELCGFLGKSRVCNAIFTAIIGLLMLNLSLSLLSNAGFLISLAVGIAAYALFYCIVELVLLRSFKELLKGMVKLPVHLVLGIAIALVFQTGLFGYSRRLPNISEIESMAVSAVSELPLLKSASYYASPSRGYQYYWEANDMLSTQRFYESYLFPVVDEITSETQIKTLLEINEKIAKAGVQVKNPLSAKFGDSKQGVQTDIKFCYFLKNGKMVVRYFDSATVELLEELAIAQQAIWNTQLDKAMREPDTSSEKNDMIYDFSKRLFSGDLQIQLSNGHYDNIQPIDLNATQQIHLVEALRKDLTAQSAQQRLFPVQPSLGILSFSEASEEYMNEFQPMQEMFSIYNETSDRKIFDPLLSRYSVTLTSDMQNTLAVLEQTGYKTLLENSGEIIAARVYPVVRPTQSLWDGNYYYDGIPSLQLYGFSTQKKTKNDDEEMNYYGSPYDYDIPAQSLSVTDPSLLAHLEKNAYLSYFNSRNAYMVELEKDNGNKCVLFVPQDKMPQSIAQQFS